MNGENKYTKTFNFQLYKFEVKIIPYEGDEIYLNPDAIIQLVIEDELLFWPKRGFISFQNGYDVMEKNVDVERLKGYIDAEQVEQIQNKNKVPFVFRNDGKDRVSIKIKPILNPNVQNENNLQEPRDDKWLIDISANIYDQEDLMTNKIADKVKKIYFWDETYQKMLEKNIQWSTATSPYNPNLYKDYHKLKDLEREIYTGEAVKDILINQMSLQVDEDDFDTGSTKIFHNAPSDWNIWDNIDYLLSIHSSSKKLNSDNNDICIFSYENYTKKFKLTSLKDILSKAGNTPTGPKEYQIEHLIVEDLSPPTSQNNEPLPVVRMAPFSNDFSLDVDVKIAKIKKYSFVDMAGVDSTKSMLTTAGHTYDHRHKTFVKKCSESQIADIPDKLQKDYIKPYMLGGSGGAYPYINLNLHKAQNKKVTNKYTLIPNKSALNRITYGKLIEQSFFLNQSLLLEIEGSTNRRTARFVGVDRMADNESEFDYKLCGQWLISYIKHNFFRNSYVNEMICVKPHTYKRINIKEDIQ